MTHEHAAGPRVEPDDRDESRDQLRDELRDELRAAVRGFLAARPGAPWSRAAAELGIAGLMIPEEHGGAGCGLPEAAVVCEELGAALSPLPYLQTAVLAAEAVMTGGDEDARRRLLPRIAEGAATATVILPGEADLTFEDGTLSGVAPYTLEGEIVLAYAGGVLVEAEPTRRTPLVPLDQTRPLCALAFDRAPARVAGDGGRAAWERVRDAGLAALAAEQVGGAAACLAASVAHAKRRHQFGRPIGSFQAIQHKLADVLLLVESARSAAYAAARATPEDLPVAAAIAGSYCAEAYATAAGENIQVHGGIGITWEHDAHRHLKRATTAARLFGPPQAHRARLAPTAGL
ncbi:alkylation response protein AidB-like acyl-CoA dehydrogenase [Thermocatellispora tengchongensis]|uniref:Alkylation response protein AidB-like acyl-CoA dehydrogenase n=1 Tax=Thermocatellispora tengchongensis TaxID=1073253 RepID=A0A840P3X4_9ACTN|nr:acyl-CoA dehydrogenase family protein [Thermocatellispora tengchongensis]MBB5133216.1 alkylation response protein AidB-like acyl-CoA dehydrogenase [Thermocatellispora tengchongensis]